MAYGFIKHLENKGYKNETLESYAKVIKLFFSYLQSTYPHNKEPFQISSKDIKGYLILQKDRNKSISTINKELAILKTFFNYLWEVDKVPVDPAMKIKRFSSEDRPLLGISYGEIKGLLKKVLNNPEYSTLRKAIFILATKGLKTSEFRFKKGDIEIPSDKNQVVINLRNRKIVLEGQEADYLKDYLQDSKLNGSDYVFITKRHGGKERCPIEVMSILSHLRTIANDYLKSEQTLTLVLIRRAIAYDLYVNNTPIQQIAKVLGIEEDSASNYLRILLEEESDCID